MSRVIVKNLPTGIKESKLRRLFAEYGDITECTLKYTEDGIFRKFAFIGFHNAPDADSAVKCRNNTYIDTTKIQVSLANSLADKDKNRPWSKHSKSASLAASESTVVKASRPESKNDKKNFKNPLLKDLENKVEFQEFLEVHKSRSNRSSWKNDIVLSSSKERDEEESEMTDSGKLVVPTSDADHLPKKLSDMDYLKSKMTDSSLLSEDDSDSDSEQVDGLRLAELTKSVQTVKYLVKMRGLPANTKESQIKEFFKPIEVKTVKIPRKKSTCVVTVEFANETDQEMALRRNKNYVGSKKIFLHRLTEVDKDVERKSEASHTWQLKEQQIDSSSVPETGLLFVRNLAYCCTEEDLKSLFETYGAVEVNLPVDRLTMKIKGFAILKITPSENAVKALAELDGSVFQGRMLHILPGKAKAENSELPEDMPFKKKKELQQKQNASSAHNWNTLFVGTSAVADVLADKYGKKKEEIFQPASLKESVGVRMALGETQIVAEIRQFLLDNGVALDSFSSTSTARSKSVFLVKHLPAGTTADELRTLFERFGTISRLVLPPGGLTAIIEYEAAFEAKSAFQSLAYSKFKHVPLYLEWAPVDVFRTTAPATTDNNTHDESADDNPQAQKADAAESSDDDTSNVGSTLFVKNLNFTTTETAITELFKKVGKIRAVTIARKNDIKNPGQTLSMGYGFVEYKSPAAAKEALKILQNSTLDGHQLELKVSNRATLQSESVQRTREAKKKSQKNSTKILIRNIPFEAQVSELRQLFGVFGELKSVRVPKKLSGTGTHRGFGFADFLSKEDARRAFDALSHSTHLYGRRLVLEWADNETDSLDELRRKTAKHFLEDLPSQKRIKKSKLLDNLEGVDDK